MHSEHLHSPTLFYLSPTPVNIHFSLSPFPKFMSCFVTSVLPLGSVLFYILASPLQTLVLSLGKEHVPKQCDLPPVSPILITSFNNLFIGALLLIQNCSSISWQCHRSWENEELYSHHLRSA